MRRVRAVIARRRILYLLILRDLKLKYANSILGYFWTILEPLLMGLVYWFVFTKIFERGGAVAGEPYIIFLLCALLPWQWASGVISASTRSLTSESKLVRSTNVPREIWVLRTVGSKFAEFVFSIPVLIAFVLIMREEINANLAYWPLALAMQWVALVGIGLILAPLTVMMVDMERLIKIIVRVMFYMSPVLYGAHAVFDNPAVPEAVKVLYSFNPFSSILSLYRAGIFPEQVPDWEILARGGFSCLMLLVVGALVFRRLERAVLKEI